MSHFGSSLGREWFCHHFLPTFPLFDREKKFWDRAYYGFGRDLFAAVSLVVFCSDVNSRVDFEARHLKS